jgi:hypothetical protein
MVHSDFISFMQSRVLPLYKEHPNYIRLDGETVGGKRKAFGYFRHKGRDWKVDEDTRFEPLVLAYEAAKLGADPFVESETRTGKATCLSLSGNIKARQKSRAKHMYIYSS